MKSLEAVQDAEWRFDNAVVSRVVLPAVCFNHDGRTPTIVDATRLPDLLKVAECQWGPRRMALIRSLDVLTALPDGVLGASISAGWLSPNTRPEKLWWKTAMLTIPEADLERWSVFASDQDFERRLLGTTRQFLHALHRVAELNPKGCGLSLDHRTRVCDWVQKFAFDPEYLHPDERHQSDEREYELTRILRNLPRSTLTELLKSYRAYEVDGSRFALPSVYRKYSKRTWPRLCFTHC